MPKKVKSSSFENIFVSDAHRAIYIEISHLKKRIHLVEGERKANYESNEDQLKKNDECLKTLRDQNSKLKKENKTMLQVRDNFFQQISKRLGCEKNAYPFRDKNFASVLDIFECKIGDLKNKLNLLQYKKNSLNAFMNQILDEEKKLRDILNGNSNNENRRNTGLKSIETSIAAMQMKITEAENIKARYKSMHKILKTENFNRNIKVAEFERKIELERREALRVQQVLQEALKAKKSARLRLFEVEGQTIQEYTEREQELYESRMKLKQIRDKMDSIGARLSYPKFHMIHRDSSISEGLYLGTDQTILKSEIKTQTTIESVYNVLAEMTGESDPGQIVIRFEEQRKHAKELEKEEENAKSEVRKAKLLKRFLIDKLGQLQFSGGQKREKLNEKSNQINEEITSIYKLRDDMDKSIIEYSSSMHQMLTKLQEICQINELQLPKLPNESSGEQILCILQHILNKIQQLFDDKEGLFIPPISPMIDITDKDYVSENESYMSATVSTSFRFGSSAELNALDPSANHRPSITDAHTPDLEKDKFDKLDLDITVRSQNESQPLTEKLDDSAKLKPLGKRSDSSEEEEAVTRNFVKRQSQIMIEAKTRKGRFNPSVNVQNRNRRY